MQFVLLSFFTLIETIGLKIWAKPSSKNEKGPLPVDVRRSKTSLLKLPINVRLTVTLFWYKSPLRCYGNCI